MSPLLMLVTLNGVCVWFHVLCSIGLSWCHV